MIVTHCRNGTTSVYWVDDKAPLYADLERENKEMRQKIEILEEKLKNLLTSNPASDCDSGARV